VRIVKCLAHGCSVEATADICDVDARTVARLLEKAGKRAEDFHHLQLDKLKASVEAVELDELHGRVCAPPDEKGGRTTHPGEKGGKTTHPGLVAGAARRAGRGSTRPRKRSRDS
jgi:hypothetical protein